ncbi:MAG: FAD-dependent oxidoreductase, partial [Pseudomonadota bacterium]
PLGAPAALRLVVRSPDAYLAPKASGRLVVGATVEPNQTSRSVDGATLDRLRAAAAKLAPALRGAPVQEAWAGLRPCTPDNAPILGRVCEDSGVFFALGHYRNGILLTPITADLIVGQALRGVGAGRLAPFAASRSSLGAAVT